MSLTTNQINNARSRIDRDREKHLGKYGIPPRYINALLTEDRAVALKDDCRYFYGTGGTGKTHMLCAILIDELYTQGKYHTSSGFTGRFITVPDLLLSMRSSYGDRSGPSEMDLVLCYSSLDLLCLDDIGAEKLTEAGHQFLYLILNRRYNHNKRTMISSNLSVKDLDDVIGSRLASRVAGMTTPMLMQGADKRRG